MRFSIGSRTLVVAALLFGAHFAAAPAGAAEDKRACCRIIRIDQEKGTAWLRNPRSALVVEFRLRADARDLFKVGDLFNPETNELNGTKLQHAYAMRLPALGEPNAHILRVRGHEIAAEMDETGTVYRFHTLKFGNVLSAMKPGGEVVIDVAGDWVFFLYEAYGKVKPSVWAYELE
jgi:hypothetical protein